MKKGIKIFTITLTTAILIGVLIILGIYGFTRLVYNQRNCEWANIDNIEMHAHVDIPEINNCDCEYFGKENIKLSCFEIEVWKVDMNIFIQKNSLKKLNLPTTIEFDERLKVKCNFNELKDSSDLYYRIGSQGGESWQILLNKTTGRLCVFIKYKD